MTLTVLVLALGLHWAVLQTLAWTGMLINYSRDASFAEAVSQTFDGEHPCAMCKFVKQGRAEEKQQEQKQIKPGSKLDPGLVWEATGFNFKCNGTHVTVPDFFLATRADEPPKPRPRLPLQGNRFCV